VSNFVKALRINAGEADPLARHSEAIAQALTDDLPLLLQKLNILLFCKKWSKSVEPMVTARSIRSQALTFMSGGQTKDSYSVAYGHYSSDLFAQLCRESKRHVGVPYAGFDSFVKMSSGNPRNLLVLLGRAYSIASFRGPDWRAGDKLSVQLQTDAANEAARFMYEADSNVGGRSELAREALRRLGTLLRTARYALNIPEVSPLVVSFADGDLSPDGREILQAALHYSMVFEVGEGRPDRNSDRVNRKIQLNPMLSPRWGLPIGRRGDLSLRREFVNAVFAPSQQTDFDVLLKEASARWNNPFRRVPYPTEQESLF
jgi:hypothetical protein